MRKVVLCLEELTKIYGQTKSISKTSEYFNVSQYIIRARLKELGFMFGPNVNVDEIINTYKKLKSLRKTSEKLGISKDIVANRLRKMDLVNPPIIYDFDQNAFEPDTAESFYWAGFIAADGCVTLDRGKYKKLIIMLSNKDRSLLVRFKKFISFTGPIRVFEKTTEKGLIKKYCSITIRSDKIFDDLARFNITPRKTKNYRFPIHYRKNKLINHFMRGFVDGDGGFYNYENSVKFFVCGTFDCMSEFSNILIKNCNIGELKICKKDNIYYVRCTGNKKAGAIRDFIYQGSNEDTRLERKYDAAYNPEFFGRTNCKPVIMKDLSDNIINIYDSISSAVRFNNISASSIIDCCKGRKKQCKGFCWSYDNDGV